MKPAFRLVDKNEDHPRDIAKRKVAEYREDPPKPIVKLNPWKERERKEKERREAILKWLLPACREAARLLVEKVEKLNQKVTESLATRAIVTVLVEMDDYSRHRRDDEIAKRRGWKTTSGAVMEAELKKLSFAQVVGYSAELRFWSGFWNYKPELSKESIGLLKEHGIKFDEIAAQFKKATVASNGG